MVHQDRICLPKLNLIHRRSRLLEMLAGYVEAGNRLITVYAAGGYGKSSLLADFSQTTYLPVCWCSLEPVDRDPTSFLTLLAYSIADRFHEVEPDMLLSLIERGDTHNSVHGIAELLAQLGPHLLIIDDFHKAASAGMVLTLNRLLERLTANSTLIVAARNDVPLQAGQLIDLLSAGRSAGLTEKALGFTPEELIRVLHKRFGHRIGLKDADEIAQVTDGNIAQILLTGHVAHAKQVIARLRQCEGDERALIYRSLAQEIFDKQSPQLQRFLLYSAVLPDMTVDICNHLLATTESRIRIEQLLRQELFVTQAGAGFRYHDLFAEFLRAKLAEDEHHYRQVCIKAAKLLAERSRFEEAANLFVSVEAWPELTALLESHGRFFYDTGRALTLNTWLKQIPQAALNQHPRLLLLRGQILVMDAGEPKLAMKLFEHAEDLYRRRNDPIGAAEVQIWKSVGLRVMGQAKSSLEFAEAGLVQLESLNSGDQVIAWALNSRGLSNMKVGNTEDALVDFRRALGQFGTLDDEYRTGNCHHNIGICLDVLGNVNAANHHFKQALRIWEALGNASSLSNTLNSLGVSLINVGCYDEALNYLNNSLDIAQQIDATTVAAFAQAGIGDVYLQRRGFAQAINAYESSTEFAREVGVRPLEIYNLVKLGECFFQQHDFAHALNLANQAREIAAEGGLMYETGLACALLARIHTRREKYTASHEFSSQAVSSFADNDVLERAKARLWWAYSLLLHQRPFAAREQLQEAVRLALNMGELIRGLGSTVGETRRMLLHFLHWPDTPEGMRESIRLLLAQAPSQLCISSPDLQVYLLGNPYLAITGRVRQFRSRGGIRKTPEFLAYLLIEGRADGCRRNEVSSRIWPDLPPRRALQVFHQTLSRLRQMLFQPADYVVVQDDHYRVNPNYLSWCDASIFDHMYERIGQASPDEVLDLRLELISLSRGEFLRGFDLGVWGTTRRSRYEQRFLRTIRLASEQLLTMNELHQALVILQKGLDRDVLREDLHRSLMRVYAKLGLYDHVKLQYLDLCDVLREELGVRPDQQTTHLYQTLTRHPHAGRP